LGLLLLLGLQFILMNWNVVLQVRLRWPCGRFIGCVFSLNVLLIQSSIDAIFFNHISVRLSCVLGTSSLHAITFASQCPNSMKLVGKFAYSLLVSLVKFLDQSKMYWFIISQLEFRSSIWGHQIARDVCSFRGLYLLHTIFVFNKICGGFVCLAV